MAKEIITPASSDASKLNLFKLVDAPPYTWAKMPIGLKIQYNQLLNEVIRIDDKLIGDISDNKVSDKLSYYNIENCLALVRNSNCKGYNIDNIIERNQCIEEGTGTYIEDLSKAVFFKYKRKDFEPNNGKTIVNTLSNEHYLTLGSLLWLYFYERMGIFKILGALLDDFNYNGKYAITYKNASGATAYNELLELFSNIYRTGYASTTKDRMSTYQRVLGIGKIDSSIEETESNSAFLKNFSKSIADMLDFYRTRQLTQAIQGINNTITRTPVANLTTIKDDIVGIQQSIEPLYYGRNLTNTFLGIATVYGTLCLINQVKSIIGIPDGFNKPEQFIPAAYDILVLKRPITNSQVNRFTCYDNCASYGYRLLTDMQLLDESKLEVSSSNSSLDNWLFNVEGLVEGYNNAFKAIKTIN